MARYYCIPDLHGRKDLLDKALEALYEQNPNGGKIVFLGDYIDRGDDSLGVVRTVMNPPEGWEFVCLMGNHEEMFVQAYMGMGQFYCPKTLQSFCPDVPLFRDQIVRAIPRDIVEWMKNLPMWHFVESTIFAHAWYNPELTEDQQQQNNVLWERLADHEPYPDDKYLVHGHTPRRHGPVEAYGRTNLDCGAVFYGRLVVAVMSTERLAPTGFLEFKGEPWRD